MLKTATKLALEIPIPHLYEFSTLTDFDFVLAHLLSYLPYRLFYSKRRFKHRDVWLDNSFNELRTPVPSSTLSRCAQMVQATHVIPPDWTNDPARTVDVTLDWQKGIYGRYRIVGVVHGKDNTERKEVFRIYQNHSILPSLPYDEDRSWYNANRDGPAHFLGFVSMEEIRRLNPTSIDTGFMFRKIEEVEDNYCRPEDLPPVDFTQSLSPDHIKKALWAVWRLRCSCDLV